MSPLDYALAASDAGLCVVPPREDGSKMPLVEWKDLQTGRPHLDRIRTWYSQRRSGMGFVCGATSGNLELFDFDDYAAYEQFRTLAITEGLADLVERIEEGYLEETPNNGVHWLYRCPEISGNKKLARRLKRPEEQRDPNDKVKVLIETRGEGGYVVAAPSSGRVHSTGKPYRLLRGSVDLITSITPEERDKLWSLARTLDEMPVEKFREPIPATARIPSGTKRPGDDFNERASWAEILEPFGWVMVAQSGDETFWRRPGSENKWSASTNYRGSDLLYVFTTSSLFDSEKSYSKFAAYALLEHNGDFSAAAHTLSDKGYGEQAVNLEVPSGGLSASSDDPDGDAMVAAQADPYPIQSAGELLAIERVSRQQIVEGLLWEGQIHWLFSSVNAGKTLLLLAIALHIAAGKAFCGRQVKQGTVLFIQEDSSMMKMQEYLEDLAELFDIDPRTIPLYFNRTQGLRLSGESDLAAAKKVVERFPGQLDVVMFDACESIVPSEKYTSKELDYLRRFLLWLVDRTITPIMADHAKQPQMFKGKEVKPADPMNMLFGGLVKKRVSDLAIHLEGSLKKGAITCTFVKARDEVPDPVELTWSGDTGFAIVGHQASIRTESEHKILRWLNNNKPASWHDQQEIFSGCGVSESTGIRAARAMMKRSILDCEPSTGRTPTRYRVNQSFAPVAFS